MKLRKKFGTLLSHSPIADRSDDLAEMILDCDSLDDVSDLTRLLRA